MNGANPYARQVKAVLRGTVVEGRGHFSVRHSWPAFLAAYREVTREDFVLGTLNVRVAQSVPIHEERRIRWAGIEKTGAPVESQFRPEDFSLESCLVNGIPAFRIRPCAPGGPPLGHGGHGDHILEIMSSRIIPDARPGATIEISLFRELTSAD
jgi:CTP-dependent riboflavin kinase